jgi:hypothetical protein
VKFGAKLQTVAKPSTMLLCLSVKRASSRENFSFADFFVVCARAFNWYSDGWAGPHNVPGSQPLIFALSASTSRETDVA